jgi:hypothetical protein
MIKEFADRFIERQAEVKAKIAASRPGSYTDIVRLVVETVTDGGYDAIDPERIHSVDDGDYQGTLVFVIGAKGYQPYDYWYVQVSYGSCSGCDTLQAIEETWDEDAPLTGREVEGYYTLCLHVAQGLKKMGDE